MACPHLQEDGIPCVHGGHATACPYKLSTDTQNAHLLCAIYKLLLIIYLRNEEY